VNCLYRPPSEKKEDFHKRCHSQPLKRGALEVSFEVPEGWNAKDIASELDRMAKEGLRIEDYRSYSTAEGTAWGISIYTKRNGTLFILKDSQDHDAIDTFFRSVRYGNFTFVSATANRQTITITREPEA